MKFSKKIKIGFSLILIGFTILFAFGSLRSNAAVSSGTITYHYSVYAKETWDKYQSAIKNENFIVGEDLKVNGAWNVDDIIEALDDYEANAPYADWIDDWGIPVPFYVSTDLAKSGGDYTTTGKGTNAKYVANGSPHSGDSATVYAYLRQIFPSKNFNDEKAYPKITQAVPGDEIFIGVTAEYSEPTLGSAVVLLDIVQFAQGGVYQKYTELPDGWSPSNQTVSGKGETLGATKMIGSAVPSPFFMGGYSFAIATGVTGSMKIEFLKNHASQSHTQFNSGTAGSTSLTYSAANASHFKEDNCIITVAGQSDDVDLTDITVENKSCITASSNVTVKGDSTKQYKGSEVSDGTANVTITVANSGKLVDDSVRYGTSIANATQVPATQSGNSFSVNMGALSSGQSYIAIFQVVSSSGQAHKWYAVELVKAKDTNCDLDGLGVSGQNGGTTADIRWSPTFSSGTVNYDVYIPKGTTDLKFTPTVTSNLKTITASYPATAAGTAVTSGTPYSIPNSWTNNSQVKFTVTAQSGATKAYTVTLKELNLKPTSVTATSGSAFTATDTDVDNDNHFVINNLPFSSNSFSLRAIFPDTSVIDKVELYQGNILSTQNILNQNCNFNITNSGSKAAHTETIRMVVIAKSGNSQTFYVDVNRLAANTDSELGTVSIVANNGLDANICNSFSGTNLTINYPGGATELPLAYKNFTITATPKNPLSSVQIRINNNVASTYTFSGADAVTVPVSIIVTAEDGSTTTYQGSIKRAGADDDQSFDIVDRTYTYKDASGNNRNGVYVLSVLSDGSTRSNPDNLLPFLAQTASFKIVPTSSTTKVYINGTDYTNKSYTATFNNTLSEHKQRIKVLIKSEYDEVTRPNNTTSGGLEFYIDLECEAPDDTRVLTDVKLLHSTSNAQISNSSNTSINGNTYTYILKESEVGSRFKLNLTWNSETTEAFVSTTNSASIMTAANKYNDSMVWNIGTKVYVYLRSQAGNYTPYTIDVQFADERSTENGIANVQFFNGTTPLDFTFNESQTSYPSAGVSLSVPYSVQRLTAEVTVKNAKETLSAGPNFISGGIGSNLKATQSIELAQGPNTFKVQGVAENGVKGQTYTFIITREAGGTQNYIESLIINGVNCTDTTKLGVNFDYVFNRADDKFSFYLPRGTNFVNVDFGVSTNASYEISRPGTNPTSVKPYSFPISDGEVVTLTINVKSEVEVVNGSSSGRTYTIKIYSADTDNKLSDLYMYVSEEDLSDILDANGNIFSFNPDQANLGTFTVPFKVKGAYFMPEKPGFNGSIAFDNNTLANMADGYTKNFTSPATYTVTIKVTSELANLAKGDSKIKDNKSFTYTLKVVRNKGSNNAYLSSLEIFIDGVPRTFSIGGVDQPFVKTNVGPYMVENVTTTSSSATINAVPEDEKATVTGDNDQPLSVSLSGTTSQIFRVKVIAEDEVTTREYSIQIWTTRANPSTDKALNRIVANSTSNATVNKLSPTWSVNTHNYNVNLSSIEEGAVLHFTKNSVDSTLYIEDGMNNVSTTDLSYDYTVYVEPEASVVLTVYLQAQDGTNTKDEGNAYEIVITRAPANTDATLKEFKINGKTVTGFKAGDGSKQYEVRIGDAQDVYFEGVPTEATTTITKNPAPASDRQTIDIGSTIFTIETTAQDGQTHCVYTVNVIKDAPKTIEELYAYVNVDGMDVDKLTPTFQSLVYRGYSVALDYDQTTVELNYVSQYVADGYNTISVFDPKGNEITSGTTTFTINNIPVGTSLYKLRVKALSGSTADYEISITRNAGSDDNTIIQYRYLAKTGDLDLTSLDVNPTDIIYKYVVGRDLTTFDPEITTADPNAKVIMPDDLTLVPGKANSKRVIVESQTGKQRTYTFIVYPCDTKFDIEDINALVPSGGEDIMDINGSDFIDYENNHLTITVANSISQTFLEVIGGGFNSVVYMNGKKYTNQIVNLKEGTNNFVIYIKSEYGEADSSATNAQSDSVTVTIIRQAKSTDSTLKELKVTYIDDHGVLQEVSHLSLPGNSVLAIPNIGDNITSVTIYAVPTDPTSKVTGDGAQALNDKNQANFVFTVKCTAEDGTYTDYPINIARGPIDIDKDNSLTYIEVSDGAGNQHLGQSNFVTSTTAYGTYKIPFSAQNYTITVVKPGYSPSIVLIDNQTVTSGTRTTTILDSDRGTTKSVTVQVQAKDGTKGQLYTIDLEFEAPSADALLKDLTADGVTVDGFSPEDEGGTYTIKNRPHDVQDIEIGFVLSDPRATIVGNTGKQLLQEGLNTFVIVVTSEGGLASYTYRINVFRDYPAPYLTDLAASGEKLLDTNYKSTTFDKDVFEYTTIVNYMTLHATINAVVDNEQHNVSCSNSTAITTTGFTRSFNVDLVEGLNRFVITVTSVEGKSVEYILTIKRRGEDSTNTELKSIEIAQIPAFKTDYSNDVREYSYVVPNGIRSLNVLNISPEKGPDADGDGAKWRVVNAANSGEHNGNIDLRVGMNTIVVIVTAEDQVSTRAIVVNVERLPMDYKVNTEAYNYACTPTDKANVYEIDLVNKRVSAIEDYTKYIQLNEEQYAGFDASIYGAISNYIENPEITIVSDITDPNCREVVVRIYDGSEEQFVTFKLNSSALNSGFSIPEILQQIMPWILLAIAIIILIIILICVNRDKYGAINKKRKKDLD